MSKYTHEQIEAAMDMYRATGSPTKAAKATGMNRRYVTQLAQARGIYIPVNKKRDKPPVLPRVEPKMEPPRTEVKSKCERCWCSRDAGGGKGTALCVTYCLDAWLKAIQK